ncbi:MAG: GTPase [Deinococcales bacterium]
MQNLPVPVAKRPLHEVKMIIVGEGSVGKTSLVNRLVRQSYKKGQTRTEGINIETWSVALKHQRQDCQIKVNI